MSYTRYRFKQSLRPAPGATAGLSSSALLVAVATCALAAPVLASPEVPSAPQSKPIALVGGTVHPVSGPDIEKATVLFVDGKIAAVGVDVQLPEGAEKLDVTGKHVYPGLIDAYTDLGLIEIPSVRATVDKAETGTVNPNVRAQVAVNPDSELIPVVRSNGVLAVLTAPTGGLISGQSAVIALDGWTFEDMTVRAPIGMHVAWPRLRPRLGFRTQDDTPASAKRDEALKALDEIFAQARAYQVSKAAATPERPIDLDVRAEAMLPVLDGKLPLIVHADELEQIQGAVAFAERQKVKLIILGGYDAAACADLLKRHDIPVIIGGVQRLPERASDAYDEPFTLPSRLRGAGIKFCISGAEQASNVRNLPYHAGMAAAYGLPRDEALKAVTLYPAQILGVADRLGSLENGKDATLIVTDGDPLETPTEVLSAYVTGRRVDLMDRHKRLWHKYQEKYKQLEKAGKK